MLPLHKLRILVMRVLVVFHIYYPEFVSYYLDKLANIHSCDWDLVVTGSGLEQELLDRLRALNPGMRYVQVTNAGYDVWPLIYALKQVNLDDYDFVIKIHTKNQDGQVVKLHGESMDGKRWMQYLVDAMIGTPEVFSNLLRYFEKDPYAGIAYSRHLDFICRGDNVEDCSRLDEELSRLNVRRKGNHFCAGTMFAVRASALKCLQEVDLDDADFASDTQHSHSGGSLAHVYERAIPIAVQGQGYNVKLIVNGLKPSLKFFFRSVLNFFSKIVSVRHWGDDHRKYLFLFGIHIPLQRRKPSVAAENPSVTVVSVVRDYQMYERCVRGNANLSGCRLVDYDNNVENLSVTKRYNDFIDSLGPEDDSWIVFCHEDWQALENLAGAVKDFDKKIIYGPVGVFVRDGRRSDLIVGTGSIMECDKDGGNPRRLAMVCRKGRVDTLDCQCVIVHSSLLAGYELRFDENLKFDMYAEDFCANAFVKCGIQTRVEEIRCMHWSRGVISASFDQALEYVRAKYAKSPKRMATIVGYKNDFGGDRLKPIHRKKKYGIL